MSQRDHDGGDASAAAPSRWATRLMLAALLSLALSVGHFAYQYLRLSDSYVRAAVR